MDTKILPDPPKPDIDTLKAEISALQMRLAHTERELETLQLEHDVSSRELLAANEQLHREARELAHAQRRQRILTSAIEAIRQGVAITNATLEDPGPRLLFINDYFLELTGFSADELANRPIRDLLAPGQNVSAMARLDRAIQAGREFYGELVYQRRDGREILIADHTSPVFDQAGELTHLISIQQDITEKKKAEEALRRSEERYRLLIETMSEGFVATDGNNRIDLVNAKMVEMLGFSPEQLAGEPLTHFADSAHQQILDEQEKRRRGGEAAPYEVTWLAKDGSRVDTIVSPTSILGDAGEYAGSFAVVTDVTERKRAEEERRALEQRIQKAQKMESLGLLAGGIAHDFNNLLVGMLGHAGLALMELDPDSSTRHLIQQIETAALRGSELTKEMLAYSGKGKFIVEPVDLSELVEEMTQLLKVSISKKVDLRQELAVELPLIEGDSTQLRQIVMNLITNAAEAIGDCEGTLTLRTGEIFADREYLAGTFMDDELEAKPYVFLEVADTGEGMDDETRAKIFDPFFTTKFTGRGLGLAAVLGIVRGHEGAIEVRSEPGRGTTFKVLFPALDEAPELPDHEMPAELSFQGSGRILVVDDEDMVRGVAQLSLETVGYTVLTAADGAEAVEIFRREADTIDAVLLDMTMPRMGGEETFRELRKIRSAVRIVVTSGFNEQETIERFPSRGRPTHFLQKPFQPQELIRRIRQAMGQ